MNGKPYFELDAHGQRIVVYAESADRAAHVMNKLFPRSEAMAGHFTKLDGEPDFREGKYINVAIWEEDDGKLHYASITNELDSIDKLPEPRCVSPKSMLPSEVR